MLMHASKGLLIFQENVSFATGLRNIITLTWIEACCAQLTWNNLIIDDTVALISKDRIYLRA